MSDKLKNTIIDVMFGLIIGVFFTTLFFMNFYSDQIIMACSVCRSMALAYECSKESCDKIIVECETKKPYYYSKNDMILPSKNRAYFGDSITFWCPYGYTPILNNITLNHPYYFCLNKTDNIKESE